MRWCCVDPRSKMTISLQVDIFVNQNSSSCDDNKSEDDVNMVEIWLMLSLISLFRRQSNPCKWMLQLNWLSASRNIAHDFHLDLQSLKENGSSIIVLEIWPRMFIKKLSRIVIILWPTLIKADTDCRSSWFSWGLGPWVLLFDHWYIPCAVEIWEWHLKNDKKMLCLFPKTSHTQFKLS